MVVNLCCFPTPCYKYLFWDKSCWGKSLMEEDLQNGSPRCLEVSTTILLFGLFLFYATLCFIAGNICLMLSTHWLQYSLLRETNGILKQKRKSFQNKTSNTIISRRICSAFILRRFLSLFLIDAKRWGNSFRQYNNIQNKTNNWD